MVEAAEAQRASDLIRDIFNSWNSLHPEAAEEFDGRL
jgi:hypothetical protein